MGDSQNILDIVAEPKNARTLEISREYLEILEKARYRSGKSSFKFLTDHERSILHAFAFTPYDPFYEEFDEKIRILVEADLCPYRMNGEVLKNGGKNGLYDEEVPALVLSMDDLGIGFIACLIPLALSVLVFVIELVVPRILIFRHKLLDLVVAVAVIAAFNNAKQRTM